MLGVDQFTFSILDADGKESANDATYDITILSGYTTQGSKPRLADPARPDIYSYPRV